MPSRSWGIAFLLTSLKVCTLFMAFFFDLTATIVEKNMTEISELNICQIYRMFQIYRMHRTYQMYIEYISDAPNIPNVLNAPNTPNAPNILNIYRMYWMYTKCVPNIHIECISNIYQQIFSDYKKKWIATYAQMQLAYQKKIFRTLLVLKIQWSEHQKLWQTNIKYHLDGYTKYGEEFISQ